MKNVAAMLVALLLSRAAPRAIFGPDGLNVRRYNGVNGQVTWILNGVRQQARPYCAKVRFELDDRTNKVTKYLNAENCTDNQDMGTVSYTYVATNENNDILYYLKIDDRTIGYLNIDTRNYRLVLDITKDRSRRYIISWTWTR